MPNKCYFYWCLYLLLCCVLSCAWLWDPTDCSPPGSSVQGILQARILEWVAMPSSRGYFPLKDQTHVSCISCIGRLYHCATWGSPLIYYYVSVKKKKIEMITEKNWILVFLTQRPLYCVLNVSSDASTSPQVGASQDITSQVTLFWLFSVCWWPP